jgi:hypothetical protein
MAGNILDRLLVFRILFLPSKPAFDLINRGGIIDHGKFADESPTASRFAENAGASH